MKRILFAAAVIAALILLLPLAGCAGGLPSPTEPMPAGNAQLRLSQIVGAVEAGTGIAAGGEANGASCVLTVLGRLPVGVVAHMQQGTCVTQVVGQERPGTE